MRRLGRGRLSTGPELTEIFRVFIVGSLRRLMLAADACVISRRCVCINRNPLVGVDDNIGTDVEKVRPKAEAHRCLLSGRHLKRVPTSPFQTRVTRKMAIFLVSLNSRSPSLRSSGSE